MPSYYSPNRHAQGEHDVDDCCIEVCCIFDANEVRREATHDLWRLDLFRHGIWQTHHRTPRHYQNLAKTVDAKSFDHQVHRYQRLPCPQTLDRNERNDGDRKHKHGQVSPLWIDRLCPSRLEQKQERKNSSGKTKQPGEVDRVHGPTTGGTGRAGHGETGRNTCRYARSSGGGGGGHLCIQAEVEERI